MISPGLELGLGRTTRLHGVSSLKPQEGNFSLSFEEVEEAKRGGSKEIFENVLLFYIMDFTGASSMN